MTSTRSMKAIRCRSRLNSSVAVLLLLLPGRQRPRNRRWLKYRQNSAVVIQVHGIERTKDRILAFVNSAAPDLGPKLGTQIEEALKNGYEGRHLRGLHKDGPHFLALTELPSGFGAPPKFAVILRLLNYQDFVKGFLKEDEVKTLKPTKDGYDVATVDSEEHYFIDRQDYVVVTPSKDLAGQLAKKGSGLDGKLKKDIAKQLLDADVAAYVDMAAVNKEYGPQIQAGRQMIQVVSGQAAEQLGKSKAELMAEMLDGLFQFIEDSTAILLTADFRPQGLAFQLQARVGEETKTNGYFKEAKKSSFESFGQTARWPTRLLGHEPGRAGGQVSSIPDPRVAE